MKNKTQQFVTVAGIKWATENLKVNKKEHFNFEEAQAAAQELGLRVPTKEEFESLFKNFHRWNKKTKCLEIIADNGEDILSLPAAGGNGGSRAGSGGYYWSSTQYNSSNGYYLYFYSGYSGPAYDDAKTNYFSVRCVQ